MSAGKLERIEAKAVHHPTLAWFAFAKSRPTRNAERPSRGIELYNPLAG